MIVDILLLVACFFGVASALRLCQAAYSDDNPLALAVSIMFVVLNSIGVGVCLCLVGKIL